MNVLRIILIALVFIPHSSHAGLLDNIGSVLRGDGKNESPKQEAIHATDRSARNLAVTSTGSASKRIALVIGNGNYHYDNLPKLANPPHDAEDIAQALRSFGFDVIEKKNLNKEDMDAAITEFGRKIADSDAALFYFAGHGLQMKGRNYLMPVNAKIESEARVPYESVDVNLILDEMDNGKSRANIVMLDACRNNPISGKFRSGATRGLAAVTSQPKGTVIVYATDPGNTAADGDGRNGLFTAGLLTAFKGNDLSLRAVLVRASKEVERGSNKQQTPYINGPATMQEEFQFRKGTQVASLEAIPTPGYVLPAARTKSAEEIEDDTWSTAESTNTVEAINAYLSGYPKGRYVTQASVKLAGLKPAPVKPADPVPAQSTRTKKSGEEIEDDTWNSAEAENTVEALKTYLTGYPKGRYVTQAKIKLASLKKQPQETKPVEPDPAPVRPSPAREDNETALWSEAQKGGAAEDYRAYLSQYPKGKYTALAKGRLQKLDEEAAQQAAQQEQSAWDSASSSATEAGYRGYLKGWPTGRFASLANARIQKLQADLAVKQRGEEQAKIAAIHKAEAEVKMMSGKVFSGSISRVYSKTGEVRTTRTYEVHFKSDPSAADINIYEGTVKVVTLALAGTWQNGIFHGIANSTDKTRGWSADDVTLQISSDTTLLWSHSDGSTSGSGTLIRK